MTKTELDNLIKCFEIAGALHAAEGVGVWTALGAAAPGTPAQVLDAAHAVFLEDARQRARWAEAQHSLPPMPPLPPGWEAAIKEAKG